MIKRFFLGLAIFCIAFAQMFFATPLWASIIFTATLLVLGTACVFALSLSGRRRAFWTGFSVFGIGYLLLAYFSVGSMAFGMDRRPELVTTRMLDSLYITLCLGKDFYRDEGGFFQFGNDPFGDMSTAPDPFAGVRQDENPFENTFMLRQTPEQNIESDTNWWRAFLSRWMPHESPKDHDFLLVGHCMFCFLVARVGGAVGRLACPAESDA